MLFFKLDRQPARPIELFAEAYTPGKNTSAEQQRLAVESLINQAHLETQGILRCSIAIGKGANRTHLFIFEVMDGDKLYMIMRFQEQLQNQLDITKMGAKSSAGQDVNFDELMTKLINA